MVALTHVCQTWREVFVSRSSLWTNLNCLNLDKTRVYLERSTSSPINLSLDCGDVDLSDPFFEFIPGITERLKSLYIDVDPEDIRLVGTHLPHSAPLLEVLSIEGSSDPTLPPTLFNGDLPSLHKLCLKNVRTELPWRNMVNLKIFTLTYSSRSSISIGQFLDFFESAPHLREVDIFPPGKISGTRTGRLVPLACLQRMDASGHLSSLLFDHLLIPVGARLRMGVDLSNPPIEGHPPRFIDNLRNLSNFTTINLAHGQVGLTFSGPNGEVKMVPRVTNSLTIESLTHFDTLKTERLEIMWGESSPRGPFYQALLRMKDLRALALYQCNDLLAFIRALDPSMNSSGIMPCPRLEELVITCNEGFDTKRVAGTVAARASKGAKLKTVRIYGWRWAVYPRADMLELEKHVAHLEFSHDIK